MKHSTAELEEIKREIMRLKYVGSIKINRDKPNEKELKVYFNFVDDMNYSDPINGQVRYTGNAGLYIRE